VPDTVRQAAHPGTGGRLVRTERRDHQDRPIVDVVRDVDDEVERRRVGPVQVLENQQQRCGRRQDHQRFLEHREL
jgi:hypothetical protein